jgi:hypothetical protein
MTALATIIDCGVEVEGIHAFGGVTRGWITMEAPLVKVVLCEIDDSVDEVMPMYLRSENDHAGGTHAGFDTIDGDYNKSAEVIRNMDLHTLLLGRVSEDPSEEVAGSPGAESDSDENPVPETGVHYQALIVTPVKGLDSDQRQFKRLGWMHPSVAAFGPDEVGSSRSTITLV